MEQQERRIIVDIDNTLWNLSPVLWERLRAVNPKMPEPSPVTLDKAASAGIIRAGLLNPWNADSAHPLFGNLLEVLNYIDSLDDR